MLFNELLDGLNPVYRSFGIFFVDMFVTKRSFSVQFISS